MNLQENIHRIKEVMNIIREDESEQEVFPKKDKGYHVTPDIYIEQIKREGLTPKTESKLSVHPERVYLYLNPNSSYKLMASNLLASSKYKDQVKNYYVLEIDLKQLPEHRFYWDTKASATYVAVYTKQPIPASAIKVIDTLPVQDLPASNNSPMSKEPEIVEPKIEEPIVEPKIEEPNKWEEIRKKLEAMGGTHTVTLNENINRIKQVMGLSEDLSDISGTPVYHHTKEHRAVSIMKSDSLIGTKPDDVIMDLDTTLKNTTHQKMISFTRDKNFVPDQSIGASINFAFDNGDGSYSNNLNVIFVVDLNKLKTRYKVVPFDYSSLDDKWYEKERQEDPDTIRQPRLPRTGKNKELEERVLTDVIHPLRPYVIDIIYKGDNENVRAMIKEYMGY